MARYLISRLSSLGDVVCTLPAAVALKNTFPDSHITWFVDPRFAGIVECCTSVDEILIGKVGFDPKKWPKFSESFDCALDMQGLLKSGIVVGRARAPLKLGYHWQREGSWLFSSQVTPDLTSLHIVDQYVDVARAAGALAREARFSLLPKPEDVEAMQSLLRTPEKPLVLLNAGAGWATKRYPASQFALLNDSLQENGFETALIGGKAEADRAAASEVITASKLPPQDLLGKSNVRQLVALASLAAAHVGGDTGSSHLTAALGKPAIGLYSITRPERSCPYGQMGRCLYDVRGLSYISPEAVLAKVLESLA